MSSSKINFTLDPLKVIRKTAEHFVANFPLPSRGKIDDNKNIIA